MDNSNRHDLRSDFLTSLGEAMTMPLERMATMPALTARVIIEGALEDPLLAGTLFDKATQASALMTGEGRRDFLFALALERERAATAAPIRWARVLREIGL